MAFALIVDPATLAAHLDDPRWLVVDCRSDPADAAFGRSEYAKSHLPGAIFLDVDTDLSDARNGRNGRHPLPDAARAAATFGAAGIGADTQVVAYDDRGGASAARLWWMLRWLGHEGAAVLDGGWQRWLGEARPVSTELQRRDARVFVPRVREQARVDAEQVLAHLARHDALLVDARAPARYRGEIEPLDAVGGHLPGALNRPLTANLDERGGFRTPELLRAEFEQLLAGVASEQVIHYCGSGVGSCHNLLAMELAGLHGSRLYPGSWSEWAADPSRPVERG